MKFHRFFFQLIPMAILALSLSFPVFATSDDSAQFSKCAFMIKLPDGKFTYEMADMDIIELNEAFAAQSLACIRAWDLADDDARINPNGGAIAIGHPLGMTGARLLNTAALELHEQDKRYALVTMCVGVGQGYAAVIERV